jgi:predicted AlkP superfamily pyrophosphatase or phosphodiesterase
VKKSALKLISVLLLVVAASTAFASAYNARPKLIVVVVIDQFRGDYLERYHDRFGPGGFRLFTDQGAWFTDCYYGYANTRTAPGHATLFTGVYSNAHGIFNNEWWDAQKKRFVSSVDDDNYKLLGTNETGPGASPHNLMASTLGDELKLATQGASRVFAIALKDRASVLPGGFAANAAYFLDHQSGAWITSTYYYSQLPSWVAQFNSSGHAEKYWNREWKDASGNALRTTSKQGANGRPANFYDVVGVTPFANDYEFEFARELIAREKLGAGPATDLLSISLSANDILGHAVGPDSPQMVEMVLTTDRQLASFFQFLGKQIGLSNVWLALSADHGVAPTIEADEKLHIPALVISNDDLRKKMNAALAAKAGHEAEFVSRADGSIVFLSQEAFASTNMSEADAERAAADALKQLGARDAFTKAQLAAGDVRNDAMGHRYLLSYSPLGGWWVMVVPPPYSLSRRTGTDHGTPYAYDAHVPLAFYGSAFRPGVYHSHAEPVDMAATLASLLGINAPSSAVGRVLVEALEPPQQRPRAVPAKGAQ